MESGGIGRRMGSEALIIRRDNIVQVQILSLQIKSNHSWICGNGVDSPGGSQGSEPINRLNVKPKPAPLRGLKFFNRGQKCQIEK